MEATEARAIAKHIRIAPRKVRIVVDLIRGKNVGEAFSMDITIVTTAETDEEGRYLLTLMGMPFEKQ